MDASEILYNALVEDFGMEGATGSVRFNLRDFGITVEQNNIIGNILEEWLDKWMTSKGIVPTSKPLPTFGWTQTIWNQTGWR